MYAHRHIFREMHHKIIAEMITVYMNTKDI